AFGFSAMLFPTALSPALMTFIGAVAGAMRRHNGAAGRGVTPSKSCRRNGRILYGYYVGMALLTPAAGILRDASGAPGAPLFFASALEFAALAFLVLLRLSQRRFRTVS